VAVVLRRSLAMATAAVVIYDGHDYRLVQSVSLTDLGGGNSP
jgi:hypothetical protein